MKKIFALSVFAFALALFSNAQSFEISAKGAFKSTWLFNKDISDQGDIQDYSNSWGNAYGVAGAWFFSPKMGVEVDVLLGTHTGGYHGSKTVGTQATTYDSKVALKSMDIPLLFKMHSEKGAYFEVGLQYSNISSAQYTSSGSYKDSTNLYMKPDTSMTSYYSKTNLSAVLGFGMNITLGGKWGLVTGLRFEWGLSDLKGVNALNIPFADPFYYKSTNPTNSAAAGIWLGLTYTLSNAPKTDSK